MEKKSLIDRMKDIFNIKKPSTTTAKADTDTIKAIRLIDVQLDRYKEYGTGEWKLSQVYGVTCPYKLPDNMTLKQACYIISYLYNEIADRNRRAYRKPRSAQETADMLDSLVGWGFTKMSGYENGYLHTMGIDNDPHGSINMPPVIEPIKNVADLFRIEHGEQDFKRTTLANRYFKWYTSSANEYDANKIYSSLSKNIDRTR